MRSEKHGAGTCSSSRPILHGKIRPGSRVFYRAAMSPFLCLVRGRCRGSARHAAGRRDGAWTTEDRAERFAVHVQSARRAYWSKGNRTYFFVLKNVAGTSSATGGGGATGVGSREIEIEVALPQAHKVVDERTGKSLGEGKTFSFRWNGMEPVFFSY
jgi:hypothetical protein